MNKAPTTFVLDFNQSIKEAEVFLCITRDSELQSTACEKLQTKLAEIDEEKKHAIDTGDEDYANLLLGCGCVASALIAELQMWLLLKAERPDDAWNELVNAQNSSIGAVKAHEGFAHVEAYVQKLETIEGLIFPPQVFISSGLVVDTQECSICGKDYEDCSHVVGTAYMGRFCHLICKGLTADHVAIVEHPADKKCRVTEFTVEGGKRNRMTWRVETSEDGSARGADDPLLCTARILGTGA